MEEENISIEAKIKEYEDKNKNLTAENEKFKKLKEQDYKFYQTQIQKTDQEVQKRNHYNSMLSVKLKEKDHDVKLSDLKIRELQKQLPHFRLKPLRPIENKRFSVDHIQSRFG